MLTPGPHLQHRARCNSNGFHCESWILSKCHQQRHLFEAQSLDLTAARARKWESIDDEKCQAQTKRNQELKLMVSNFMKARTWTHSRTGRNRPLSRQSMWKEPPACWTWTNPTSPHWSPLSPRQPDFVQHSKMKNCLNSTHQGVPRSFCEQSRCHKRTMAHVSLLQSQDVEVSVAGCPETACPWRLFARQRMGKLTDPGRKSSGDVKLLCAPRLGNKQYP